MLFYPGSGSDHSSIQNPGFYKKSGMKTYFYLSSYAFRSKVLVIVIVKKIRDQGSGKHSSWIRIPDPGGKKAPEPRSGSATLT
jgi:hypothetical protein